MGVIGGAKSLINGMYTTKSWSISHKADLQAIIASNTYGGPVRLEGNKDWSGTVEGWGHTPPILPGDIFSFTGSIDGSLGATGSAICDSTTITINVESGAVINYSSAFSANGALTFGAAVVAADDTCPSAYSPIGAIISYDVLPDTAYATLPNVKMITINITADNQFHIDSSTAGETLRLAGNINCTVDIDVNIEDTGLASLPAVNSVCRLKITLASGDVYDIDFIRFASVSDITADRETAAIISAKLNGLFSGVEVAEGTECEAGQITLPDRAYWPAP